MSVKVFANGKQLPVQVGEFSFTRRINLENEVKMTCLCGKTGEEKLWDAFNLEHYLLIEYSCVASGIANKIFQLNNCIICVISPEKGVVKLKLATHSGLVEKKKPTFIFR